MLPPGSCGYPVIGDKSIELLRDPMKFFNKRISQYSNRIFQDRILNTCTVFVCCPLAAKELLQDKSDDFEMGYKSFLYGLYGDNILFEDGSRASQLKSLLVSLMNHNTNSQEIVEKCFNPLFSSLTTRDEPVCVYTEFKQFMIQFCFQLFLDLDFTESQELVEEIQNLAADHWHGLITMPLNVRIPFAGKSTYGLALDAKAKLLLHIRHLLSESNSSSKAQDSDSLFKRLKDSTFPQDGDAEQNLLLFVSAVIPKAFASIITSFIVQMAGPEKKSLRERCRNEKSFLSHCLLEVERLWPPFLGGRRIAKCDTSLGSYKVPKGYAVLYVTKSAHTDPQIFPNPLAFNPDRWATCNKDHKDLLLCFGAGLRGCIGTALIQNILLSILTRLINKFDWELSCDSIDDANDDATSMIYKYLPIARPSVLPGVVFSPITK